MSEVQTTEQTVQPVTTESTPQATVPILNTTQPQTTIAGKTWKEAISEEFRNDPNISKFTELDALAKSYINATKMIGADKVSIPNKNSTEDQWNEVYAKLGRPMSPTEYKLDFKSEIAPIDENSIKTFATNAHKLGLNNKQAQGILEFYKSTIEQSAKEMSVNAESAQAQSANELRQEWGRSFDENLKRAGSVAKTYLDADFLDMQLRDGTRIGDHPKMIRAFAKIAETTSEDKIVSSESGNAVSVKDIEKEIDELTLDRDGAYWNKNHPNHKKVVNQVLELREILYGGEQ